MAIAKQAVVTYGLPIEIDPKDAVLQEVYRTAGAVAYLQERVRALELDDLVWGRTEEVDRLSGEFPGTDTRRQAVPNAWLVLYQQERKHLVAVCKTAHDMGIERRRIELAEAMGAQLAAVMRAVLNGLGLTPQQWELVPTLLAAHIPAITGEAV